MKKLYTLLMMCLIGTVASWAGEATTIYERGTTTAWSSDDLTDWVNTGGTLAATINGGLQFSANNLNPGPVYTKSITTTKNSIVTFNATFKAGGAPNRDSSYDYIKFGGISFRFYEVNKQAKIDIDGTETLLFSYTNRGDVYSITVTINQAKGDVSYSCNTTNGTATSSTSITSIEIGHYRGGREGATYTTVLQNVSVSEELQDVTTAGYTVNYIYSNDTIKSTVGSSTVGATVNAESPITIDGTKYYAADGTTTSMTITSDATANVLNVNLRKALTKTVSIIAVDGDGNELKRFSTECIEGEAAKNLFYTRAVEKDGGYYTIAAANANGVNYGKSVSYTSSDENKIYTLDKSITYYAEESDLNVTRSYAAQGQAPERGSGGDWQRLYANSYAYTDALPAGVYKLDISGRSQSASSNSLDIDVRLADGTLVKTGNTVTWGNAVCSVQTFEGINVPEGASIVVNNATEYNTNVALDYVIAYRTGDATERITINEIGVSSYVTTYPLDFSNLTELKALIATSETEDQIIMTKVTEVPANTPIIVRGTAGTYDIPVGTCTALPSTNLLKGSATESINAGDVEGTVYALKKSDGEFHKVAATVTIPAKIAYFVSTATTAGAKEIKSYTIFGEEETAVSSVNADTEKASVRLFNVAGQQVGAGYKGLVIDENGNKYIK